MRLYKCSKCGKEVIPPAFRRMGMNPDINSIRFCCCKEPDITESRIRYEKEMKMIAQAIIESTT